ncbi:unnamed protein product [Nippostrongylus brasiliensis]|uniref:G protein-coupled receptor n=1 Tax=Nippostrongylus brasiliensis TaxID=27835 RepID=A0A0N4Y8M1_NIPBR|nr:unnamed protein product [Nippostrongylus brasiliensis]
MFCAILLVTLDDYSFVTIAMCMVFKYHTLVGKAYSMWQIFTVVFLFSLLPLSPGIALLIHNPDYEQLHEVLERLRPEDELRRYGEYCGLPDVKNAFVLYLVLIRRYALSSYNKMSPQSSHAFDMMIKALVIQSFVPVFIWLPSKILYLLTQFTSFHSVFVEYLLLALSPLLAVVDPCVTLYYILPYRKFVRRIFCSNRDQCRCKFFKKRIGSREQRSVDTP